VLPFAVTEWQLDYLQTAAILYELVTTPIVSRV